MDRQDAALLRKILTGQVEVKTVETFDAAARVRVSGKDREKNPINTELFEHTPAPDREQIARALEEAGLTGELGADREAGFRRFLEIMLRGPRPRKSKIEVLLEHFRREWETEKLKSTRYPLDQHDASRHTVTDGEVLVRDFPARAPSGLPRGKSTSNAAAEAGAEAMADSPSGHGGPFREMDSPSILHALKHVYAAAETSGLPCTYFTVRHTRISRPNKPPLERLLVDLSGSDAFGEMEERHSVGSLTTSVLVSSETTTRYRRDVPRAEDALEFIRPLASECIWDQQRWYTSEGLLTGDWNYCVDAGNRWPLWACAVGSGANLTSKEPREAAQGESGLSYEVLAASEISGASVALWPFFAVRLKQDLIRIDRSHLRRIDDRTEQATIMFELGTLGWTYVLSNRPTLRYTIRGRDQVPVHSGTVDLGQDELKYGVVLAVPESTPDRRIHATDLELLLNGVVVDRCLSAYIRSIAVSVRMKGM